jgi:hypothetical protein
MFSITVMDEDVPIPSYFVYNTANFHAHVLYALETPVYTQIGARLGPIRYAAAIDVALTKAWNADPSYAGLICKNPRNSYWQTTVGDVPPYTLDQLAKYLDLEPYKDRRKHLPAIGLGRNCTLFEVTRRWAYRKIRQMNWETRDFIDVVTDYAEQYNAQNFPTPLPLAEVKATGKSIARWTMERMSAQGLHEWHVYKGRAGGRKSGAVRAITAKERADEIKAYKAGNPRASIRDIAALFGCSIGTVSKYLNC